MAYQVLARKWRPQGFDELIGQEPIVTALSNALSEGRIAQAYLFSGIRGVGKTTAARVFAKALNCEAGPRPDPCNECVACVEITRGSDMDVIEVDAATYSKVEQVRELTESLKYGPARDRYKVVVLDEIHRLSRQAFDALLKIVEEPPPHLVFVFATTEIDAVPATILSRCQEFHFRRVPAGTVAAHLARLAEAEGIEAGETALRLVARAGEGSVRDSVALLDQLATFGGGEIPDEAAARLLGGHDLGLFADVLDAILAGEPAGVGEAVARVEAEGWDPRHVFAQFLAYCRDALHLSLSRPGSEATDAVDLTAEDARALAERAREAGYENLLRLLHHLLASEATVRRSDAGTLALEIAWLRAAELPKLERIEELLAGAGGSGTSRTAGGGTDTGGGGERRGRPGGGGRGTGRAPARGAGPRTEPPRQPEPPPDDPSPGDGPGEPPPPRRPPADDHRPEPPPRELPPDREPVPAGDPPPSGPAAGPARTASEPPGPTGRRAPAAPGTVAALLEEVESRRPPLAAHLADAQRLELEGRTLRIVTRPGDDWLERNLARRANRDVLDRAVAHVFGEGASWERVDAAAPEGPKGEAAEAAGEAGDESEQEPTVQNLLDLFDGRVETVEQHGSARKE